MEGAIIGDIVRSKTGIPVLEIEVPPITDSMEPTLRTRLEALIETVINRRQQ
jgi:benzoyl-CoA reductase/2-hydroxyglutaryl-CoA dehydratase subunit BcrC/BadD/HgdB